MKRSAKKAVKAAVSVPGLAKQAQAKLSGEHGILNTLAREHGEVSALLNLIHVERKRGAHASDAEVLPRVRLLTTLSIELLAHARAEEEVFYSALERFPDAAARLQHSRDEHNSMELALQELLSLEYSSDRWLEAYEGLMDTVEHHVEEEENEIFALANRHLAKKELKELDERFQEVRGEQREKLEGRSFSLHDQGRSEQHAP